jgi:hypothetical protein
MARYGIASALLMALSACAEFPALDAAESDAAARAPYPALVPLGPLLDVGPAEEEGPDAIVAGLTGRAAALAARADALRAPVIAEEDLQRLAQGPR